MKTFEVEIKSLLGSKENALKLKQNLQKKFPSMKLISKGRQLNHYFNPPQDMALFAAKVSPLIPKADSAAFADILAHGSKVSLRTRDADGKIILVIKASVGGDTSSNGVKRVEFEVPVKMTLPEIDKLLMEAGASYQAKWSREREEFGDRTMHVCIDKNAGYGYLAEFEKVMSDEQLLEEAREEILSAMKSLGIEELSQDRLERMFAHYNAHWPEYYGTEKTFIIE
jgi:adenylate cyclase class IV